MMGFDGVGWWVFRLGLVVVVWLVGLNWDGRDWDDGL